MSDRNDLSGQVSIDTTNFKAGVTELNRQIRVIESGFRAAAAGMEKWDESSSGLETRIKALNAEIGLQRQKVDGLKRVYQELAAGGKTSAKELEELQIKINRETESLNKMESELKQSTTSLDKFGQEEQEAGDEASEASGKVNKFAGVVDGLKTGLKAGLTAIAGLAAGVAGVGLAIGKLVLDTAKASAALVDMSAQTGISTTRLQEMAYIGDQVGTSAETMTGAMSKLTRTMSDALDPASNAAKAFKDISIPVVDANGKLRDNEAVFKDVITALGTVTNETERDALAMEIFGKSAQELNPLIKAGAGELDRLSQEAHDVGAVMSEETVAGMEAFDDQLSSLKAGLKGTLGELAGAFLPGFAGVATLLQGYLKDFSGVVKGADGDIGKMADGIGNLIGKIVTDLAGKLPELLKAGLGIIQGIINAIITNLPIMIPAVITMITSLVDFIIQNLPLLITAAIELVMALVNGILPQLPMLVTTAIQMITTLINGIAEALPQLLAMAATLIPQIIIALISALPMLIEAALKLIMALLNGLIQALPILISYIPEIITAIYDALIIAMPMIFKAAGEMIVTLISGIVEMLPSLGESAIQIIAALVKGIGDSIKTLWELGGSILAGVWQGIQDGAAQFAENVRKFFTDLIDGIKEALGIHSPSEIFAGLGRNMAAGLGIGFADQFAQIEKDINRAIYGMGAGGGLNFNVPAPAGGGMPAPVSAPVNINVYATLNKNLDMYVLARRVAQEIQRAG